MWCPGVLGADLLARLADASTQGAVGSQLAVDQAEIDAHRRERLAEIVVQFARQAPHRRLAHLQHLLGQASELALVAQRFFVERLLFEYHDSQTAFALLQNAEEAQATADANAEDKDLECQRQPLARE